MFIKTFFSFSDEHSHHQSKPNINCSEKSKSKKVCFSDNVTDINEIVHNRSMDSIQQCTTNVLVNQGQNNLNKSNTVPPGVIDMKRNKLLYGADNFDNRNNNGAKVIPCNMSGNFVPPRPPRSRPVVMDTSRHSMASEESEDGASTTSGSYVVDMTDFDDVGTATVV